LGKRAVSFHVQTALQRQPSADEEDFIQTANLTRCNSWAPSYDSSSSSLAAFCPLASKGPAGGSYSWLDSQGLEAGCTYEYTIKDFFGKEVGKAQLVLKDPKDHRHRRLLRSENGHYAESLSRGTDEGEGSVGGSSRTAGEELDYDSDESSMAPSEAESTISQRHFSTQRKAAPRSKREYAKHKEKPPDLSGWVLYHDVLTALMHRQHNGVEMPDCAIERELNKAHVKTVGRSGLVGVDEAKRKQTKAGENFFDDAAMAIRLASGTIGMAAALVVDLEKGRGAVGAESSKHASLLRWLREHSHHHRPLGTVESLSKLPLLGAMLDASAAHNLHPHLRLSDVSPSFIRKALAYARPNKLLALQAEAAEALADHMRAASLAVRDGTYSRKPKEKLEETLHAIAVQLANGSGGGRSTGLSSASALATGSVSGSQVRQAARRAEDRRDDGRRIAVAAADKLEEAIHAYVGEVTSMHRCDLGKPRRAWLVTRTLGALSKLQGLARTWAMPIRLGGWGGSAWRPSGPPSADGSQLSPPSFSSPGGGMGLWEGWEETAPEQIIRVVLRQLTEQAHTLCDNGDPRMSAALAEIVEMYADTRLLSALPRGDQLAKALALKSYELAIVRYDEAHSVAVRSSAATSSLQSSQPYCYGLEEPKRRCVLLMRASNCRCKLAALKHREGHQADAELLYRHALEGYDAIVAEENNALQLRRGESSSASMFLKEGMPRLRREASEKEAQESEAAQQARRALEGLNLVRRDQRGTQAVVQALAVRVVQRAFRRALRFKRRRAMSTVGNVRPDIVQRAGQSVTSVGYRLFVFGGQKVEGAEAVLKRSGSGGSLSQASGSGGGVSQEERAVKNAARSTVTCDFFLYGTDTDTWHDLRQGVPPEAPWPPPRAHHVCVLVGARLLLYGGYGSDGNWLRDAWQFDLQEGKWDEVSTDWPPPGSQNAPPLSRSATDAPAKLARDAATSLIIGLADNEQPPSSATATGSGGGGKPRAGSDKAPPPLARASTDNFKADKSALRGNDKGSALASESAPSTLAKVSFATPSNSDSAAAAAVGEARGQRGGGVQVELDSVRSYLKAMPQIKNSDELISRRGERAPASFQNDGAVLRSAERLERRYSQLYGGAE